MSQMCDGSCVTASMCNKKFNRSSTLKHNYVCKLEFNNINNCLKRLAFLKSKKEWLGLLRVQVDGI